MGPHRPFAPPGGICGKHPVPLFAILLALAVPVFFLFLGANSVWDTNEAFYVETPRQMVRSGDYINPTFNAAPRFNKPVLSYWIVAGLYRAFGDSVAVERVGIAIGAVGDRPGHLSDRPRAPFDGHRSSRRAHRGHRATLRVVRQKDLHRHLPDDVHVARAGRFRAGGAASANTGDGTCR